METKEIGRKVVRYLCYILNPYLTRRLTLPHLASSSLTPLTHKHRNLLLGSLRFPVPLRSLPPLHFFIISTSTFTLFLHPLLHLYPSPVILSFNLTLFCLGVHPLRLIFFSFSLHTLLHHYSSPPSYPPPPSLTPFLGGRPSCTPPLKIRIGIATQPKQTSDNTEGRVRINKAGKYAIVHQLFFFPYRRENVL